MFAEYILTPTSRMRGEAGMNGADGFGKGLLRRRKNRKGGIELGWMVESRQGFQTWRKASGIKAWRCVRGSQESNSDQRILMHTFEGNCMSNYISILGSHTYIYYLH